MSVIVVKNPVLIDQKNESLLHKRETYVTFAKALATPSEKKDGGVKKTDFWGTVDKNLEELRESKNHDKVRISTVIGDILADDRKAYVSNTSIARLYRYQVGYPEAVTMNPPGE
ncbi:hypothetical protein B0H14DRAFT_2618376 [Mycena olivaceomarginata]|nr:hypothetical protein B0H14DRAFT_2618376 [Mycena olivaceomarginata]